MSRHRTRRWLLAACAAGLAAGSSRLGPAQAPTTGRALQREPTTAAAAPAPSGWYQWRGSMCDGISAEKYWSWNWPADGPRVAWRAAVGAGYSAVTVSNGRAYTLGNKDNVDTVWCFNADTGEVVWKYAYPCPVVDHPGPRSTPADDGAHLYTLSSAGHFFCFDAAKGTVLWKKDVPKEFQTKAPDWGLAGSPLILGDWVVIDVGPVVALTRDKGELVWRSATYPAGYSSPMSFVMDSHLGLATFNAGGLVLLNAAGGKELARYPWKTEYDVNAATPIFRDNKVFISSGYEVGCALLDVTRSQPQVLWRSKVMRNHFTTCVLLDGYLYGFDESQVRCLEFNSGQVKWTRGGLGKGSLMAADGKLVLISEDGNLVIAEASPAGYKQLARAKVLSETCWTMPVLCRGKIYCRNHRGDVVCLDVSKRENPTAARQ